MKKQDNHSPLFSVIVPTYNHVRFLETALDSVLQQSFDDWELICVDNNSTDATIQLLKNIRDKRVSFVQKENYGSIAKSRNHGVSLARGEWIAFLDSDDWWTSNKLAAVSNSISDSVDVFYHNMRIEGESRLYPGKKSINSRQLRIPVFLDLLLNGNTIATSSVVIRRNILNLVGGMNENLEMRGTEDFNTWLKVSQLTQGFKLIDQELGFYRVHEANTSTSTFSRVPYVAFQEFAKSLSKKDYQHIVANFEYSAGRRAFLNKEYRLARISLIRSLFKSRLTQRVKSLWMLILLACRIVIN